MDSMLLSFPTTNPAPSVATDFSQINLQNLHALQTLLANAPALQFPRPTFTSNFSLSGGSFNPVALSATIAALAKAQAMQSLPAKQDPSVIQSHFGSALASAPAQRPPVWNLAQPLGAAMPVMNVNYGLVTTTQSASSTQPASPAASDEESEVKKAEGVKGRKDRRKQQGERLVYTRDSLQHLFTLPLCEAAARLNMSARSLASVCRKLGIKKWPYKPPHYR
jgi:hypothetical protein